jgi:hypothetical protein
MAGAAMPAHGRCGDAGAILFFGRAEVGNNDSAGGPENDPC